MQCIDTEIKSILCYWFQPHQQVLITNTHNSLVISTHVGTEHMNMLSVSWLSAVVCAICSNKTFNRREVMQSVWSVSHWQRCVFAVGSMHLCPRKRRALTYQLWGGQLTFDRTMLAFVGEKQKETAGENRRVAASSASQKEQRHSEHNTDNSRTMRRALQSTYQLTRECQQLVNDRDRETNEVAWWLSGKRCFQIWRQQGPVFVECACTAIRS